MRFHRRPSESGTMSDIRLIAWYQAASNDERQALIDQFPKLASKFESALQEDQAALPGSIDTVTFVGDESRRESSYEQHRQEVSQLYSDNKPRDFADYKILGKLGKGGMGVVFKARQQSLNRIVALKMIKSGEFAQPEEIQRFRAEAEAAANLDHPGIVSVHEVGEFDEQHYFSMAYIEGESLADKLRDGPLPPRAAAEFVKQIAEAVEYAHQHQVIHRDIKPCNVLIGENGKAWVTDFGLAKRLSANSDLTATGHILGTPGYMSPEQARGEMVDGATDVYSIGATLYALITGRPPFQAATIAETVHQLLQQDAVDPRELNPSIDTDLPTICLKCLAKEPERRYLTAK